MSNKYQVTPAAQLTYNLQTNSILSQYRRSGCERSEFPDNHCCLE